MSRDDPARGTDTAPPTAGAVSDADARSAKDGPGQGGAAYGAPADTSAPVATVDVARLLHAHDGAAGRLIDILGGDARFVGAVSAISCSASPATTSTLPPRWSQPPWSVACPKPGGRPYRSASSTAPFSLWRPRPVAPSKSPRFAGTLTPMAATPGLPSPPTGGTRRTP